MAGHRRSPRMRAGGKTQRVQSWGSTPRAGRGGAGASTLPAKAEPTGWGRLRAGERRLRGPPPQQRPCSFKGGGGATPAWAWSGRARGGRAFAGVAGAGRACPGEELVLGSGRPQRGHRVGTGGVRRRPRTREERPAEGRGRGGHPAPRVGGPGARSPDGEAEAQRGEVTAGRARAERSPSSLARQATSQPASGAGGPGSHLRPLLAPIFWAESLSSGANLQPKRNSSEVRPAGSMAGGRLGLGWVLSVSLMVSAAGGPSAGTHGSPLFLASGVEPTPTAADVSIRAGSGFSVCLDSHERGSGPLAVLERGLHHPVLWGSRGDQCRSVCGLNVSLRCDFIRTNPDCRSQGGYLDYLAGIFCHAPAGLLPLPITLYVLWLLYLFLILGVTAAKFFCPNLSAIATTLKLSHNVAGVTFLAFGNGAPDIFSALVAFSDPRTASLAIGALFGAGVLVTTVVAGGIPILRPFVAASRPFLRDIAFYMTAVFLTFTALYLGRVTLAWALGYLGLYVFYVVTVVLCTWVYRWQRRRSLLYSVPGTPELLSESEEDQVSSNANSYDYGDEYRPLSLHQETTAHILAKALNPLDSKKWRSHSTSRRVLKVLKLPVEFLLLLTVPVVDPDKDDRNWKRPLNCLHLVVSPLVVVLTLQSGVYGIYEIGGLLPVWAVVVIAGTAVASATFFATSNREPPKLHWLFAFLGFLTSALWINAAATEVVNILRCLGVVFRLSNTVLGLTLLAWGNSIGDAFSDFTLARQGYPRMAFSACFGGIIFNILVGVGLGCLLQMARDSLEVKLEPDGLLVWVLAGALGLSLVLSLVSVPLQCFRLGRSYGAGLLSFYAAFLVVALLTEFGVIRLKSA
ncbi:mitochondrial sodium/calcium exchanger protein [Ctenodactylus gundi]